MIDTLVADRARVAGAVGEYLKMLTDDRDVSFLLSSRFSDQISYIYKPSWGGRKPTPLRRAALSFLCAEVPVQVPIPASSLWQLVDATCQVPELPVRMDMKWKWAKNAGTTVERYPLKKNPAASNKVNLFLYEVARDLARKDVNALRTGLTYLEWLRGQQVVYNDQATAVLLYGYCLSRYHPHGWRHAVAAILPSSYAKGLSVFGKAVGINGTPVGAMLVEATVLLGRDVAPIDLTEEAWMRVTTEGVSKVVAPYPEDVMRRAVRKNLLSELKRSGDSYKLEFPSLEDHWATRWRWAVNGAHSGLIYKRNPSLRTPLPGFDRVHRRAWLETVKDDPRPSWDGKTYVSASPKLELGKTRAIFACDTINYLAFEHLMSTVEANWRGERIILNPGKGGHLGMANRVRAERNRSGVSLMLDYDDFNSHHTTDSMRIVLEELCEITGYPPELAAKLIRSLDDEHIYVGGKYMGRVLGTLMSGHRLTTFFNSVLNKAYLDIELGDDIMDNNVSLHVGDDVYLGVRSYKEADTVLARIRASRLRMNPAKQSVGHVSTEFLRIASESRYSYGYLARSVASITSGNWVSEARLAPLEALNSMLNSARSLANRSGLADAPLLLVSSVSRMAILESKDDALIRDLLLGKIALGNGPQFQSSGMYRYVDIKPEFKRVDDHGYGVLPLEATHLYLTTAATELETEVLIRAGVSVEEDMARASYAKSSAQSLLMEERLVIKNIAQKPVVGVEWAEMVLRQPRAIGLLTPYPLLLLARARLPERLVRYALHKAGGDYNTPYLEYDAWGEYAHGCVIDTVMSYTDASALGSRTAAGVLTSATRMYV
uniref:RNA-directed RNA polymerase n=1 Tax=Bipolaris maydis victorivirus 2 TaxID=2656733 RepID=A0A5P9VQC4_9VIRU|nr:RNA dependent RNA polymerase [Bipolaris maydis victorivirus 2]